ncbi:MAG: DegV family protein [Clostridia bacterium]|nr:DegV family protein [Clostridia bacterium]
MAIRIVTDSTADLPEEAREAWGILTAPMGVVFDGQLYLQDIDMSLEAFYDKLVAAKEIPSTTQVNPETFVEVFAPVVEAGDQVLAICVSSGLSSTYQCAVTASKSFPPGSVFVVDTRNVTIGAAILVARAVEMREAGAPIEEIASELRDMSRRVVMYAVINDLSYPHKGGRLPTVGLHVLGVLDIKPIVSIWNGVANSVGLARGMRGAYRWIAERAAKEGIDRRYCVAFGHTNAPQLTPLLEAAVFPNGTDLKVLRHPVGMVLGAHAGPGSVAMAYIKK